MNSRSDKFRIPALDFIRGCLVFMMMLYHFFWDLGYFGYIDISSVISGIGLLFAQFIGASFIFFSGVSVSLLYSSNSFSGWVFLVKFFRICSVSILITLVTWFVDSQNFIYFGILHLLSVCYLLAYIIFCFGNRFLVSIILVALSPFWLFKLKFNISTFWAWIGVTNEIPASNDFYPLIPWGIFFLLGIISSNYLLLLIRNLKVGGCNKKFGALRRKLEVVHWAGRRSLLIYICHQPVFFSLFLLFNTIKSD